MFISPIQNNDSIPVVTQGFGYTPFANAGSYGYRDGKALPHIGIDLRTRGAINLYSPTSGTVKVLDSGDSGYGLHIAIRNDSWEIKLAHLSKVFVKDGDKVNVGDLIGKTGNSGFSTAHHLHYGVRPIIADKSKDIWDWKVKNYDNVFYGYVDPVKLTLNWQGTFNTPTLNYLTEGALEGVMNRRNIT